MGGKILEMKMAKWRRKKKRIRGGGGEQDESGIRVSRKRGAGMRVKREKKEKK